MASDHLFTHAQYVAVVRPLLPKKAFAPSLGKLWQVALHLVVIGLCFWGMQAFHHVAGRLVLSAVIGHSLTCLVFVAHDLSHGGIIRRARLRYPLEVFLWGMNLFPATMWRKLHNENHHAHANTVKDPDRFFRQSEFDEPGGRWRRRFARWSMPSRHTSRWNPAVNLHMTFYILRHLAAVFYPDDRRPAIVTYKPRYRPAERRRIVFEVACIAGWQFLIYMAVGQSVSAWIWAGPVALAFDSTFAMSYIWTNHYLQGLHEWHDPLLGSTSIEVPGVFDRLHSNFSYHTEHHLFPAMNSKYYPLVCEILLKEFPDRYNRVPVHQAWKQLANGELYVAEDGGGLTVPNPPG